MEFIESQIKKTEEDFAKKIEPLERKRKFIIERKSVENKITIILGALGILVAIIIAALDWFVFV